MKTAPYSWSIRSPGRKPAGFLTSATTAALSPPLARGARVLDLYCYTGGFSVHAARAGAAQSLGIDRSEPALALAGEAAALNGVDEICSFRRGEVFAEAERLAGEGKRFDIVVADPPPFAKSRKEIAGGVARLSQARTPRAALTARGGFVFLASCSYNVGEAEFAEPYGAVSPMPAAAGASLHRGRRTRPPDPSGIARDGLSQDLTLALD